MLVYSLQRAIIYSKGKPGTEARALDVSCVIYSYSLARNYKSWSWRDRHSSRNFHIHGRA